MAGLVLVFDLDQTLVDTDTIFEIDLKNATINSDELYNYLNIRLIEDVLKPAVHLKGSTVAAILLLSNNSLEEYVKFVCDSISRIIGTNVFDSTITRNGAKDVARSGENPPKRLLDVENILKSIGKDTSNLADRIYFFDDLHHIIEKEIRPGHYCLIHNWLMKDSFNEYGPVRIDMGIDAMPDLALPPSIPLQSKDPGYQTIKKTSVTKRPSILGVFPKGGKRTRKKNSRRTRRSRR